MIFVAEAGVDDNAVRMDVILLAIMLVDVYRCIYHFS